ncbi:hypothetical protein ECANGB1_1890 [Enterospora canceri]|uniref:Uncharacterized protein n=1 Tax=Enterospora canceri TaxID=1081671 RepID=A0A1Y1S9R0_9MICR|nr:hypothetical protein ECANGB1_1890 [Enterospora canceri]
MLFVRWIAANYFEVVRENGPSANKAAEYQKEEWECYLATRGLDRALVADNRIQSRIGLGALKKGTKLIQNQNSGMLKLDADLSLVIEMDGDWLVISRMEPNKRSQRCEIRRDRDDLVSIRYGNRCMTYSGATSRVSLEHCIVGADEQLFREIYSVKMFRLFSYDMKKSVGELVVGKKMEIVDPMRRRSGTFHYNRSEGQLGSGEHQRRVIEANADEVVAALKNESREQQFVVDYFGVDQMVIRYKGDCATWDYEKGVIEMRPCDNSVDQLFRKKH